MPTKISATEFEHCCRYSFSRSRNERSLRPSCQTRGTIAGVYAGAVPAACFQYLLATNGIFVTLAVLLLPLTTMPTSVPALW